MPEAISPMAFLRDLQVLVEGDPIDKTVRMAPGTALHAEAVTFTDVLRVGGAVTLTGTGSTLTLTPVAQATAAATFAFFHGNWDTNALTTNTGVVTVYGMRLDIPNITVGTLAPTNAVNLYIAGAPTEGSSINLALWVDAGSVRFDGSLFVESTPTEGTAGEQLQSAGAAAVPIWAAAGSRREYKDVGTEFLDTAVALAAVVSTPVFNFKYVAPEFIDGGLDEEGNQIQIRINRKPSTGDFDTDYVGILAEDAPWAMHHKETMLNPVNTFGYTVLAIKELKRRLIAGGL